MFFHSCPPLRVLQEAGCVELGETEDTVSMLPAGRIASFYYLKYTTMGFFREVLGPHMDMQVRRSCPEKSWLYLSS